MMMSRVAEIEKVITADGSLLEVQTTIPPDVATTGPVVDLLLAHACGFCKDTLTPFASEVQARLPAAQRGRALSFDFRGHGSSGPLLEETRAMILKEAALVWNLGKEDLRAVCGSGVLQRRITATTSAAGMTQHLEAEKRPLVLGVGHSMGGAALVKALLDFPRAEIPLDALVLFEPVVSLQAEQDYPTEGPRPGAEAMIAQTRRRKNAFPSREEAKAKLGSKPPYSKWDRRAFDGFLATGLRPKRIQMPNGGEPELAARSDEFTLSCSPELEATFYATEQPPCTSRLHELGVGRKKGLPTLIIIGADSGHMSTSPGVPKGGSYGEELRRHMLGAKIGEEHHDAALVDLVTMPGLGHLGPMEQPGAVAEVVAAWIERRVLGRPEEDAAGLLPTSWEPSSLVARL